MKYNIDPDTLNEAEHCTCNYSCLKDKSECLCNIDYNLGNGRIIFLKSVQNVHCQYILSYGNSYICTCPVRKKIYRLYSR
jgi:hypothetical protein